MTQSVVCGVESPNNLNRDTNIVNVDEDGNLYVTIGGTSSSSFTDTILNGQLNVTTAGTAVQLTSNEKAGYVKITYKDSNSGEIYVGDSNVSSSNGYILNYDNNSVVLSLDDLSKIYIDSSINGEGVSFVGSYIS